MVRENGIEKLLIDVDSLDFKIIGCRYDAVRNGYKIKYKCRTCGARKESYLNSKKICILRCNDCSRLMYIFPICSNRRLNDVIGYNILSNSEYREIRSMYNKEKGDKNLCEYIANYIRINRKINE